MWEEIKHVGKNFALALDKSVQMQIFVQRSVDGIAAGTILSKALARKDFNFSLSFFQGKDSFSLDSSKVHFFIGAPEAPESAFLLTNTVSSSSGKVLGFQECSLSVLAYGVALGLSEDNKDLLYLALLPYLAGKQVPQELLKETSFESKEGIVGMGSASQPIHRMLELSVEPFLPGVSGSEDGAFSFLRECGISAKENGKFRSFLELSEGEVKEFIHQLQVKVPSFQIKPRSILLLKEEDSIIKDLYGLYLLIQGVLEAGNPSLAVSVCLYPKKFRHKAYDVFLQNRRTLINALQWFYLGLVSGSFQEKQQVVVVNVGSRLPELLEEDFVKVALTQCNASKIVFFLFSSLEGHGRVIFGSKNESVNLKNVVSKVQELGCQVQTLSSLFSFSIPPALEATLSEGLLSLSQEVLAEELVRSS